MLKVTRFDEGHTRAVLALIGGVYAEYGMTFDPDVYDADLTNVAGKYEGGAFWVLEDDGRVVGTVAIVPLSPTDVEIKRVYLDPALRGQGWGRRLTEHVIAWAAARGYTRVILWSDVRLPHAHGMYRRLGFTEFGARDCDDIDKSREIGFERALRLTCAAD